MTQFLFTAATMKLLILSVFLSVIALAESEGDTYVDPAAEGDTGEVAVGEVEPDVSHCLEYVEALRNMKAEKELLRSELDAIKARLEAAALQDMDEDESIESNESHSRSRGLRGKRGTTCEGGTINQWACGPQCIYKLKGLCGLSLRAMCHC